MLVFRKYPFLPHVIKNSEGCQGIKLNWKFLEGCVRENKTLLGEGGMDIFWNMAMLVKDINQKVKQVTSIQ